MLNPPPPQFDTITLSISQFNRSIKTAHSDQPYHMKKETTTVNVVIELLSSKMFFVLLLRSAGMLSSVGKTGVLNSLDPSPF